MIFFSPWPCDLGQVVSSLLTAGFLILEMVWVYKIPRNSKIPCLTREIISLTPTICGTAFCVCAVGANLWFWPPWCQSVAQRADQPAWIPWKMSPPPRHCWRIGAVCRCICNMKRALGYSPAKLFRVNSTTVLLRSPKFYGYLP